MGVYVFCDTQYGMHWNSTNTLTISSTVGHANNDISETEREVTNLLRLCTQLKNAYYKIHFIT